MPKTLFYIASISQHNKSLVKMTNFSNTEAFKNDIFKNERKVTPWKHFYFCKYCFLFFPERYTAIEEKKELYMIPHRNDDTKITEVNETGKRKNTPLFFQFYKLFIWDSHGQETIPQRGEHILIAVPVLYSEIAALFSHRVKENSEMSVWHKNKKLQTKRFRTGILRLRAWQLTSSESSCGSWCYCCDCPL